MLQLTHASNYIKYWTFRGLPVADDVKVTLDQHTHLADSHRPIQNGHKGMYDPTNSLSDASTHISSEIIERRNATANLFEAADSAGCYWAWSGAAGCADEYETQQASTLRSLDTDHGTKYYYENSAFGKVAGTVNTGSPSSHRSGQKCQHAPPAERVLTHELRRAAVSPAHPSGSEFECGWIEASRSWSAGPVGFGVRTALRSDGFADYGSHQGLIVRRHESASARSRALAENDPALLQGGDVPRT